MINNNWIEKLWDKHCKLGGYCVKSPNLFEKDVENHISNLLTKKDQEHKAELEMIKGEILKFEVYDDEVDNCRRMIGETIYILDSHINKQNL